VITDRCDGVGFLGESRPLRTSSRPASDRRELLEPLVAEQVARESPTCRSHLIAVYQRGRHRRAHAAVATFSFE